MSLASSATDIAPEAATSEVFLMLQSTHTVVAFAGIHQLLGNAGLMLFLLVNMLAAGSGRTV